MPVYVFMELIPTCNSISFNSGCFLSQLWCHSRRQPRLRRVCISATPVPQLFTEHTWPFRASYVYSVYSLQGEAPSCSLSACHKPTHLSAGKSSREPQAPPVGFFVLPWHFASVCLTCPVKFGACWKQQRMRDCEPWFLVPALCPLSFGAVVRSV